MESIIKDHFPFPDIPKPLKMTLQQIEISRIRSFSLALVNRTLPSQSYFEASVTSTFYSRVWGRISRGLVKRESNLGKDDSAFKIASIRGRRELSHLLHG